MNQINIEFKKGESKYITIYKEIKRMIIDGRLKEGEKLPSKRSMSENLGVSINTIMGSYDLLLFEGYVYGIEKSGYFVTENKYFNRKRIEISDLKEKTDYRYDFTNERVDESIFPSYTLRKITYDVMMNHPSIWLDKSPYQGSIELRTTIAKYLYENKGMDVDESNIVIVSSLDESLDVIEALVDIKRIGMENPGYQKVYKRFSERNPILYSVDAEGIVLDRPKPLDMIYVTPYNQFPKGYKMSVSRKKELLSYPTRYILEDDFDCDLISENKVMSTLYSMNNTKVIYHGSFSHTICPGIRLSYLVLPDDLIIEYKRVFKGSSSRISSLDQALIDAYIKNGYYYRHLMVIRKSLEEKRSLIRKSLLGKNIKYRESALSFFIDVTGIEEKLSSNIKKHSIKVNFISSYMIGDEKNELIIGYLSIKESDIREGLGKMFENI